MKQEILTPILYIPEVKKNLFKGGSELKISGKMSPISEFLIDATYHVVLNKDNVLIEYPSTNFDISLIIAYYYAKSTKKTVVIFSNEEDVLSLNDKYYHLVTAEMPLFNSIPIGVCNDEKIILEPHFVKTIPRIQKEKYIKGMELSFKDESKPKIIITSNKMGFSNYKQRFNKSYLIESPEIQDKGLYIFNDLKIKTLEDANNFVAWAIKEKVNVVLKVTNSTPKILELFREKLSPIIIPMSNGILKEKSSINSKSIEYFEDVWYKDNKSELDRFNIDNSYNYKLQTNISIDVVENGKGIYILLEEISYRARKINTENVDLKREVFTLVNSAYEIVESFSTPDYIKKYSYHSKFRINGIGFCNNIKQLATNESLLVKSLCSGIVDSFWTIRDIIEKCIRPNYENGYTKRNKNIRLYEIVKDKIENTEAKVYIVTTNRHERSTVSTEIHKLFPNMKERIHTSLLENIDVIDENYENILIISGKWERHNTHILSKPFKLVIILAYGGRNEKDINKMIRLHQIVEDYQKELFSVSIDRLSEYNLYKSHSAILSAKFQTSEIIQEHNKQNFKSVQEYFEKHVSILYDSLEFYELKKYDSDRKIIDETLKQIEYKDLIKTELETIMVIIKNLSTGEEINRQLVLDQEYIIIDSSDGEIKDSIITPSSIGSYIVLRAGSEKSSLLDLLINLYGLGDSIDTSIIELWDDEISKFKDYDGDNKELYRDYRKIGGSKDHQTLMTWLRRSTLGPRDRDDVKFFGHAMKSKEIVEKEEYIFEEFKKIRNIRIRAGKHCNKVISMIILGKKINSEDPDLDIIWGVLHKSIYKIIHVE